MEDRQLRLSSTPAFHQFARVVSVAGNPLFLVPLTVAAATHSWTSAALVAATTTLPLIVITLRNVRRGTWADFDVSRRDQRLGLYRAGAPLLLLASAILYATGAHPRMMRSVLAALLMFVAGLVGHRFLKISMHMMFSTFCGVLIMWLYPWSAAALVPFLLLIAWSRHHLGRHTLAEIAVGTAIGIAAGFLAVL